MNEFFPNKVSVSKSTKTKQRVCLGEFWGDKI